MPVERKPPHDDDHGENWLLAPSDGDEKVRVIPKSDPTFYVYRIISIIHRLD